jgi:hypothetical protein
MFTENYMECIIKKLNQVITLRATMEKEAKQAEENTCG